MSCETLTVVASSHKAQSMPARAPAALAPARLRTGLGLLGARWAWAARVDPTGLSVLEVWPRTAGSRWLGRPRACAYVPKAKFHLLVGQHHLYPNPISTVHSIHCIFCLEEEPNIL